MHFASGWATLQHSAGSRLDFQVSLATEPSPLQFSQKTGGDSTLTGGFLAYLGSSYGGAPVFASLQDLSRSILGCTSSKPPITIAWKCFSSCAVTGDSAPPSIPALASSPLLRLPGSSSCPVGEAPRDSPAYPTPSCIAPCLSLHCDTRNPNAIVNPSNNRAPALIQSWLTSSWILLPSCQEVGITR